MKNLNHQLISVLFTLLLINNTTQAQHDISQFTEWKYAPPQYVDSSAFFEKTVSIPCNKKSLPGVLTIPVGKGPFPAVILLHDLGPNDKDETTGSNKPFKDLAWGLASKGIAVLRYDKRAKTYADKKDNSANCLSINEDVIDDALEAYNTLKEYDDDNVRFSDIYILGHSYGASLAPRIMNSIDNKASGLIMIASPYRYMDEVLFDQLNFLRKQAEIDSTDTKQLDEFQEKIKNLTDIRMNKKSFATNVLPYNLCNEYWSELNKIQPVDELKNVKKPLLFLQGGKDFQVSPKEYNFFKTYLSTRKSAAFKLYPELNHLMIKGSGIASPKEYETEGHVEAAVINDIAAWIKEK